MLKQSTQTAKLDLRLSPDAMEKLQAAASASRRSVSEFVLESALVRADETLIDRTRFSLDVEQWKAFLAALDAPSRKLTRLKRLFDQRSVFRRSQGHVSDSLRTENGRTRPSQGLRTLVASPRSAQHSLALRAGIGVHAHASIRKHNTRLPRCPWNENPRQTPTSFPRPRTAPKFNALTPNFIPGPSLIPKTTPRSVPKH